MNSQRTRIQTALMELAQSGRFLQVTYDRSTGLPNQIDLDSGEGIKPTKVLCNETVSTWDTDTEQGRRLARRRFTWAFELRLEFPVEVTLEAFEAAITDTVPKVAASDGLPQVLLQLLDGEAEHPVQHSPSVGTRVVYVFEALEGRR